MQCIVAISKATPLEINLKKSLQLIKWEQLIKKGSTVVVKPNMGAIAYYPSVISTPLLIHHLVATLGKRASRVIVGESDGLRYSCNDAFEKTGVKRAAESAGGEILNFSESKLERVALDGLYLKELTLPRILLEADHMVNVPVIKTHECSVISCSLKNMFGCIPDRHRILLHHHLDEVIVDVNTVLKSDLVVTDGIFCMEGNGPIHGPVKKLDIILTANNALANDMIVASEVMKTSPMLIRHLALAQECGLGPSSLDEIVFLGNRDCIRDEKFALPSLDIVSRIMLTSYRSKLLTWLLYVSPLFHMLNSTAWAYRDLKGKKRRKLS